MKTILVFLLLLAFGAPLNAELLCGLVTIKTIRDEKAFFLLKRRDMKFDDFMYEKYRLFDKENKSILKYLANGRKYCLKGNFVGTYPVSFAVKKIVAIRS